MTEVFAFECNVAGKDWADTINAHTRGKAKAAYFSRVREAWPDIPFTALLCRKLGRPHTNNGFVRNAEYRGMPEVRCGQRVRVGKAIGAIVGHNSSANFDVLFDLDSPEWAGLTLNCHPAGVELI